ncbi:Calx-beta domain-containing protein, partial [Caenimonas sp. SL110]|uniref:Calx-beta domain-containing protein n=1 Tax=Caenimonas sp. SL110 TaxID=1450524 RepID=UPI000653049F
MAWTTSISNVTLRNLADLYLVDGVFSFTEIRHVIGSTINGDGLTATEFSDLKLIYDNSASLSLFSNAYVGAISYNLIYGNAANAKWTAGVTTTASVVAVGNLVAGSSEANVGKLLSEWFGGGDLPMPIAGGDSATGKASTNTFSYATATGTLFVGGATANDVRQGSVGDCYYVATLGSVANANSAYLTNMFTDNGDGTYGVKFFYNGKAVYTTVNMKLPVNASNTLGFSGSGDKTLSSEMWVPLAEKAYAQINQQFATNEGAAWTGENSYQAIEGGLAQPIKQLTNLNYKYYSSAYSSINDGFDSGTLFSTNPATYKQTIIDALNGGAIGWLASWGTSFGTNGNKELVAGHAYMLLGYNAVTDKFIIRNPWGDGGGGYNAQFEASIETFWNSSVKGLVALSDSAIADPVYNYTLASNAASSGAAATEGTEITFTITRSASGTVSTVYFSTAAGTASAGSDYASSVQQSVTFGANETVKTVKVTTLVDTLTEGAESFSGKIIKNLGDTVAAATTTAFIKDAAVVAYTYTLTNNANSTGAAVAEGGEVTVAISRSGSGTASTIYLSTRDGTAVASDYAGFGKIAVQFAAYETNKTVTIKAITDVQTETVESFNIDLFANPGDTSYTATTAAFIKDTVAANFSYTVTSNASSAGSAVGEGDSVTFTITRTGTGAATTIYASTGAGSASAADFQPLTKQQIDFAANQTVATITVATSGDMWLENPEYFRLDLFKNSADTAAFAYGSAWIKDTPFDPYNYSISSGSATAETAMAEGGKVTFTITRSSSGTESTVYVSTTPGTADGSDIALLTKQAVTFAAYETVKTITVQTNVDSATESPEYFYLDLFKNQADTSYTTYADGYVKDAPVVPVYNYTLASNAATLDAAATEGGNITFTITRSASGTASTVYVSTTAGTATGGDYVALNKSPVSFAAYETVKTVTVPINLDGQTEGAEYFWLDLYKNVADTEYTTYATGNIKDAVVQTFNYTVTSSAATNATAAAEGTSLTFTITRSATGAASTVYVTTTAGSADGSDYSALNKSPVTFSAYETTKTVTVPLYADSSTESIEYFWLDLYKNAADTSYTTYASAYVKDAAVASYDYTVVSNAASSGTAVTEGGNVTFTITRSGSGSAS